MVKLVSLQILVLAFHVRVVVGEFLIHMPCVSIQIKTFICISGGCSWLSKFYGRVSFYKRLQSWCLVRFGARKHFMSLVFLVDTVGRASLIERTSFRRGLRSRYLVRIEMGITCPISLMVKQGSCKS